MNATLRTAAAALLAAACAAPALALGVDEANLFPEAKSTVTRAQVRDEFLRARAEGQLPLNSEQQVFAFERQSAPVTKNLASNTTREKVKAELAKARAEGTMVSFEQLPLDKQWPAVSTRTREEVRAEARYATQRAASRQGE